MFFDYICRKCQYEGRPRKKKRGSGKTEFAAWMLFPLGIPYTLWRMLSKIYSCPNCGSEDLTRANSEEGLIIKQFLEKEISGIQKPLFDKQEMVIEQMPQQQRERKPQDPEDW